MKEQQYVNVTLQVGGNEYSGTLEKLTNLLQKGFMVKIPPGLSIYRFFAEQLNLVPSYIKHRISTVFLNGKPVDDIETAIISTNATLALSGAMPGLVGAVMRRDSFYASFRDTISYRDQQENKLNEPIGQDVMLRLKLFNLVLKDLGPGFIETGIYIEPDHFNDFFSNLSQKFLEDTGQLWIDGKPVEWNQLKDHSFLIDTSFIKFKISKES